VGRIAAGGTAQVRIRPPGGALAGAVDLDTLSNRLMLIAGPDGSFAALWTKSGATFASVRPSGGAFGGPRQIAPEALPLANDQVALDGQGNVWIAYVQNLSPFAVTAAVLPAQGSATSFPLFTPTSTALGMTPSLGVSSSGGVRVVYLFREETNDGGTNCAVNTEVRAADGTPSAVTNVGALVSRTATGSFANPICTLNAGSQVGSPHVAVSAAGAATALFSETPAASPTGTVEARQRDAGAAWPATGSAPETVATANAEGMVAYGGGTPVAAIATSAGTGSVALSSRGAGGTWATPAPESGADGASSTVLVGSPGGPAVLAFRETQGQFRVQALVRSTDGTASPATDISGGEDTLSTLRSGGVDEQGNAVVGWTRHSGVNFGSGYRAMFAGYDGAGPRLDGLTVPSTGVAGQPLAFSVAPVDVWGLAGAPTWTFGDGKSGAAASISHTYSSAGAFGVSVSATDAAGNTSTASRTVNVTAGKDRTKPVFRGKVKVKPAKVKSGKTATISFSLSEPAKLKATLTRSAPGVKKGKRCVAPPRKHRKGQKRCTRAIPAGSFSGTARKAGAGKLTLPAKLRGRKLPRGKYTLTLVATDAAGNRSKPARAGFTVK
jgi:hypothetical protein